MHISVPHITIKQREAMAAGNKFDRLDDLKVYLAARSEDIGIIYCSSKFKVQHLHLELTASGIRNTTFTADTLAKSSTLQMWRSGRIKLLVATSACGMGVNISNIRYVVNCDMPMSLVDYIQQIGRAGRDGAAADVIYYYCYNDIST